MALEREKEDLLAFKTSASQHDIGSSSQSLSKAMLELKLKEGKIKTLKKNLDEKEYTIVSLNGVVVKKDTVIATVEVDKKEVKEKWSKENTKLIGKTHLCRAKHILWDYFSKNYKLQRIFKSGGRRECFGFVNKTNMQELERRIGTQAHGGSKSYS